MNSATSPRQIAFVGASGSGKTTLIEAVVPLLIARGVKVGVVKHTHHLVDWDRSGKDSWRFREAGADRVILLTPELLLAEARRSSGRQVNGLLTGLDLVIHEGGRASEFDKVLVGESPQEALAKGTRGAAVAIVGGECAAARTWFDRNDIAGVAAFLIGYGRGHSVEVDASFDELLERSVTAHGHLCPGQVLGVRMAMRGLRELGLSVPPPPKRLIAVVETDRCAADAVGSVSGCSLGKRTLKHYDFGKMAASFLDLQTGAAVRIVARDDSRVRSRDYAPGIEDPHRAQTEAYRAMPDEELMTVQRIRMELSEADTPGRPRGRVPCSVCGEEVSDGRELFRDGKPVCRACAGQAYYAIGDDAL